MPKHKLAIELIEKEIGFRVNLRDYYSRVSEKWPNVGDPGVIRLDEEIASLQHTREGLVLIG